MLNLLTCLFLVLLAPDPNWNLRNEAYLEKTVPANISGYLMSSYRLSYLHGAKWAYAFMSNEGMTPEQGKELLLRVQRNLVEEIRKNPEAIQYLYQSLDAKELKGEDIAVKITFWTKDYDRLQAPNLAQIFYLNGKVYYNYADGEGNLLETMALASS